MFVLIIFIKKSNFMSVDSENKKLEKKKKKKGVPVVAQWLKNLTRNYKVAGSIPGLT